MLRASAGCAPKSQTTPKSFRILTPIPPFRVGALKLRYVPLVAFVMQLIRLFPVISETPFALFVRLDTTPDRGAS
jgi:hypothetical protein